jgi:hypothetical protein
VRDWIRFRPVCLSLCRFAAEGTKHGAIVNFISAISTKHNFYGIRLKIPPPPFHEVGLDAVGVINMIIVFPGAVVK